MFEQDCDPEKVEIVLVKNFQDEKIDQFCSEKGVKTANEAGTLGDKMAAGIENSEGEILCFLDDDDVFIRNKLTVVENLFTKYPDSVYIHNAPIMFSGSDSLPDSHSADSKSGSTPSVYTGDGKSPVSAASLMRKRAHWYGSCISVRRDFAMKYMKELRMVPASYDKLWFFAALNEGKTVISISDMLTGYRLHESLTTVKAEHETFLHRKQEFYSKSLKCISHLRSAFNSNTTVRNALRLEEMHERVIVSIFSPKKRRTVTAKEVLHYSLVSVRFRMYRNLVWSVLSLMSAVAPRLVSVIFYRATINSYSS